MVNISFEKKVFKRLFEQTKIDFEYVKNFIIKFEKKYNQTLFDSFINHLKDNAYKIFTEDMNREIRYYLICNVFIEFEKQQDFEFESFYDKIVNIIYTDPKIHFDNSFFKELESELKEDQINKLVEELNCFLEI